MAEKQREVHLEAIGIEWPQASTNSGFPTLKLEVRAHELAIVAINKQDGNVLATVLDVPFATEVLEDIAQHIRVRIGEGEKLSIHLFGLGLHGSHVDENDLGEDSLSAEFFADYIGEIERTNQNVEDGMDSVGELRELAPEKLRMLSPASIHEHYIETNERQTITLVTRSDSTRIKKSFEPDGVETRGSHVGELLGAASFNDRNPLNLDDEDFD